MKRIHVLCAELLVLSACYRSHAAELPPPVPPGTSPGDDPAQRAVYIGSGMNAGGIAAVSIDAAGAPSAIEGSPFANGGYWNVTRAVAFHAGTKRLFSVNFEGIQSWSVDSSSGALELVDELPARMAPSDVEVTSDGRRLFVAGELWETGAFGGVFVVNVAEDGTLAAVPGSPFEPGGDYHDLELSRSEAFLFASEELPVVHSFAVAPDGSLTEVAGAPFAIVYAPNAPDPTHSHDLATAPHADLLFVAGGQSDAIHVFRVDESDGALEEIVAGATGLRHANAIELDGDGSRLFALGDTSPALHVFDVSGDGSLTPIPGSPFAIVAAPSQDSGLEVSQDGDLVFIPGETLSVYSMASGAPVEVSGSPLGSEPSDVYDGRIAITF